MGKEHFLGAEKLAREGNEGSLNMGICPRLTWWIQQGLRSQADAETCGGEEQRMSVDEGMERKDLGPRCRCI